MTSDLKADEQIKEATEKSWFTLLRFTYTQHAVAWMKHHEQQSLWLQVVKDLHENPSDPTDRTAAQELLVSSALKSISTDGMMISDTKSGCILLKRFIEAAISVVDWDFVVTEILKNHIDGGK